MSGKYSTWIRKMAISWFRILQSPQPTHIFSLSVYNQLPLHFCYSCYSRVSFLSSFCKTFFFYWLWDEHVAPPICENVHKKYTAYLEKNITIVSASGNIFSFSIWLRVKIDTSAVFVANQRLIANTYFLIFERFPSVPNTYLLIVNKAAST